MSSDHIWKPPEIFVFGSNEAGIHGAGAARFAVENCGAVQGIGYGLQGMAFAIPTCSLPGRPLPLDDIRLNISRFLRFAKDYKKSSNKKEREAVFFLTKIGCGLAGYSEEDIAPMFHVGHGWPGYHVNIHMPPEWCPCLGNGEYWAGCHHCDEFGPGVNHSKCDSYYGKCKFHTKTK